MPRPCPTQGKPRHAQRKASQRCPTQGQEKANASQGNACQGHAQRKARQAKGHASQGNACQGVAKAMPCRAPTRLTVLERSSTGAMPLREAKGMPRHDTPTQRKARQRQRKACGRAGKAKEAKARQARAKAAKTNARHGGAQRKARQARKNTKSRPLCHLQYPVAYLSRLQRILPAAR
ncbi:unnamed protein product [Prunus brigantina]